jgi:cytochrome c-type biogenesis protein CcmH
MWRVTALVAVLLAMPAMAAVGAAPLTPTQEARAVSIGSQLRCLVCQNESVEESNAALAADLRRVIREQVAAGRTNHEIMQWMTARYGNFIRLDPPFNRVTVLLWSIPVLAPAVGIGLAFAASRRRQPRPLPLTEAEKSRLAELLE